MKGSKVLGIAEAMFFGAQMKGPGAVGGKGDHCGKKFTQGDCALEKLFCVFHRTAQ